LLTAEPDTHGVTWSSKIKPQDLVVIQMMNYQGRTGVHGAGALHTVMIGFVDTITRETTITPQGKPRRVIAVRGRDAGKLFIHGVVTYWNFYGAEVLKAAGFIDPTKLNDAPNKVLAIMLDQIFAKMLHVTTLVNGSPMEFWAMLGHLLQTYPSTEFPGGLDYTFLGEEGSFWSFFSKLASPPFHELWIDTRRYDDLTSALPEAGLVTAQLDQQSPHLVGGVAVKAPTVFFGKDRSVPCLFMRPTPFPYLTPDGHAVTDAWDRLVRHEIGTDDLVGEPFSETLSVSDAEQFNLYLVFPHYPTINDKIYLLSAAPVVDARRIRRYGYKPFMPQTTLLKLLGDDKDDPMLGFYHRLAWRLASWNVLNDQYESGTKTCKLSPHLHIGERLVDRSRTGTPMDYYIESVSHQVVVNERATTTLGLTRGLRETEDQTYVSLLKAGGLTTLGLDAIEQYRKIMAVGQRQPGL